MTGSGVRGTNTCRSVPCFRHVCCFPTSQVPRAGEGGVFSGRHQEACRRGVWAQGGAHVQPALHPPCWSQTRGRDRQEAEGTGVAGSSPLGQRSPEAHPLMHGQTSGLSPGGRTRLPSSPPHQPRPGRGRSGRTGPSVGATPAPAPLRVVGLRRLPRRPPTWARLPLPPASGAAERWEATEEDEDGRSSRTICSSSVFCEFISKWYALESRPQASSQKLPAGRRPSPGNPREATPGPGCSGAPGSGRVTP